MLQRIYIYSNFKLARFVRTQEVFGQTRLRMEYSAAFSARRVQAGSSDCVAVGTATGSTAFSGCLWLTGPRVAIGLTGRCWSRAWPLISLALSLRLRFTPACRRGIPKRPGCSSSAAEVAGHARTDVHADRRTDRRHADMRTCTDRRADVHADRRACGKHGRLVRAQAHETKLQLLVLGQLSLATAAPLRYSPLLGVTRRRAGARATW